MELVLRSKRIFVGAREVEDSFVAWDGQVRTTRKRVRVYDYVFSEEQERVLEEAMELAGRSGVVLEVTDLSRLGGLQRRLLSLGRAVPSFAGTRPKPLEGRWLAR